MRIVYVREFLELVDPWIVNFVVTSLACIIIIIYIIYNIYNFLCIIIVKYIIVGGIIFLDMQSAFVNNGIW